MRVRITEAAGFRDPVPHPSDYLWFDVLVEADPQARGCPELDVLDHRFVGPFEHSSTLHLHPHRTDAGWVLNPFWQGAPISPDFAAPMEFATGLELAEQAYGLVHRELMACSQRAGYARLHAAVADVAGARVLLAAPSGVGKTTLALRLAQQGAVLHSDEGALIQSGRSLGLPRRAHVKDSGSWLWPREWGTHQVSLAYTPPVHAYDIAAIFGPQGTVRLSDRPTDLVVILGERDAELQAVPVSPGEALGHLLPEAGGYGSTAESITVSRSRLVAEVAALLRQARAIRLDGYANPAVADLLSAMLGR